MSAPEGERRKPQLALSQSVHLAFAFIALAWLARAVLPGESDVVFYHAYANALMHGPLQHGLPSEYPALAGVLFVVPALLHLPYAPGLALLMAAAFAAIVWAGRQFGPDWTRRMVIYSALSSVGIVFARYDLVPVLAMVLSLASARRERWVQAWAWACLGGLLKLFPFLLLPGYAIAERRRTGSWPLRRCIALVVGLAGVGAIQALIAPGTLLNPARFEASRGLEYSSLSGSLSLLLSPTHLSFHYRSGNLQVYGTGRTAVQLAVAAMAVAGLASAWVMAYRGRFSLEATSLAVLSIAVLANKSFAPQYLLWVAPLWALWPLRPAWAAAAGLSSAVYPLSFLVAQRFHLGFPSYPATVLAAVRNLALIIGTVSWLSQVCRSYRHSPSAALTERLTHKEVIVPCSST